MPIDHTLIGQLRPVQNQSPFELTGQLLQFQGLKQQLDANNLKLKEANQAEQDRKAIGEGYQLAIGPDGKFNRDALLSRISQAAPHLIPQVQENLAKADRAALDADKIKADLTKSADEHDAAELNYFGALAAGAQDAASFGAALAHAQGRGHDVAPIHELIHGGMDWQEIRDKLLQQSVQQRTLSTGEMNAQTAATNAAKPPAPPAPRNRDEYTDAVETKEREEGRPLTEPELAVIRKEFQSSARDPLVPVPDPKDPTKTIYVRESKAEGMNVPATQRTRTVTGRDRDVRAFYSNMLSAAEDMDAVEGQLTTSDLALIKSLPVPELIANAKLTQAGQTYAQALQVFTENRLRKKSGAAIANNEYENDKKAFGRSLNDTPQTIAQKKRSRDNELDGLASASGPAYEEYYGEPYQKQHAGKKDAPPSGTVKMQAPDGSMKDVPADQVEHYKTLGAKVVK